MNPQMKPSSSSFTFTFCTQQALGHHRPGCCESAGRPSEPLLLVWTSEREGNTCCLHRGHTGTRAFVHHFDHDQYAQSCPDTRAC